MRSFWNLFALIGLAELASWWSRRAIKAVGIYRFSRAAVSVGHTCNDQDCPGTVLISAMRDTHTKVRTEALLVVGMTAMVAAVFVFIFVELMNRMV